MMIRRSSASHRALKTVRGTVAALAFAGAVFASMLPSSVQAIAQTTAQAATQPLARRLSAMPSSSAERVALPGTLSSRLQTSQQLGSLAGETLLDGMSLVLKPTAEQDAALTQLIADQQNPASASYHQWLTPAQYGARFGIADGDLAVLQSWLQTRGFTVESVAPSRNRIVFSGTASAVENAFGVTMQRFSRNGQTFFENGSAVSVPASLSDIIGSVTGLSSYRLTAPSAKRLVTAQSNLSPNYTTSSGKHLLVPWDFRQIYGVNTLISAGFTGSGIKIGVIGQSAVDTTQITYFQQNTGQTVTLPTMTLVPNTGVSNKVSLDEGESELDLEYASGTAPGASIQFIYTGCTSTSSSTVLSSTTNCNNNGVFDALAYAITNNVAPILTLSYGGCESDFTSYATAGTSPYESVLKQANAQGQTILVSSGDEGAATCDQSATAVSVAKGGLTVSYPASSQYVVGVGGTQLNSDASTYWSSSNNSFGGSAIGYVPETSWNDSATYGSIAATGGGVSKLFTKPTWQGGTGVPADGHRDVPDVAFPANVMEHGYQVCSADAVCTSGSAFSSGVIGGTSIATPNFAAMLAVIEQANGGGALGNINPVLYTLAQGANASTIFHDITTGNNVVSCQSGTTDCTTTSVGANTMGYFAGTGYDQVTGLGSIDAPSLRTALSTVTSKTPTLALLASSTAPAAGANVTFTLNVGGTGSTPTGTVQFAVDGTNVGSAVTLASGVATYTYSGFATAGSHTVTATYSGDSNYNTGTANITVTAYVYTPTITLSASSTTTKVSTALTFTANVVGTQGTPTGTVQFAVDGANVGSAVTLTSGVATYSFAGFTTSGAHLVTATYGGAVGYKGVTSSTLLIVVASPTATLTPTVTLAASPASPVAGSSSTLTATVAGTGATPTGSVVFTVNGALSTVALGSGTASTTATFAAAGSYTITATYVGDATYLPVSTSITVTVASPGFTMSAAPSTLTVTAGSSGTETLTISPPSSGFTGTVNLTYKVATVSGATFAGCLAVNSSAVNLSGTTAATVPIKVLTTASACSSTGALPLAVVQTSRNSGDSSPGRTGFAAISIAGLLGCFFLRRRVSSSLLMLAVLSALTMGLAGCGGSSSGITSTTATSSGTYTFTLIGTSGTTSASTPFTLTVQ